MSLITEGELLCGRCVSSVLSDYKEVLMIVETG